MPGLQINPASFITVYCPVEVKYVIIPHYQALNQERRCCAVDVLTGPNES